MDAMTVFKKSCSDVVEVPSITLSLVLFLILINLMISYIFFAKSVYVAIIVALCAFLFFASFITGWFGAIKRIGEKREEWLGSRKFYGMFLESIGINIIPVLFATIVYFILLTTVIYLASYFASYLFGSLDPILKGMSDNIQDGAMFIEYIKSLSPEEIYPLYATYLFLIGSCQLFNFIFMFYFPAIFYDEKTNIFLKPFCALIKSVCFLFRHFIASFLFFIILTAAYLGIVILRAFVRGHSVLEVLIMLASIYFVSITFMVLFKYYGKEYHSNNGSDCIGEDETCDNSCEKD